MSRAWPRRTTIAALIVVLAAAVGGAGSWYAVRTTPSARLAGFATQPAAGNSTSPSPRTAGNSTSPSPRTAGNSTSPSPRTAGNSTSPSPRGQSAMPISLAPPAALYPEAALIQPVVAAYFGAINHRDYAAYLATQNPGNALTAQQFQTGFRSTKDSDVLVTSIAIASDGRPDADVTFTSQQQPADGPDGESCTNWHLTMFFDDHAGTYTLGVPPADYHASYQACS